MRLGSLNAIESELRVPKRLDGLIGPRKPSADTIGRVFALIEPEAIRTVLAAIDHQFKHDPRAILNFILTLFVTFVLLQSFYQRNLNPELRGQFALIAIAAQIRLGLAVPGLQAPWLAQSRGPPP